MIRIDSSRAIVWSLLLAFLVCTKVRAANPATATKPDPLPRYKLSVGQELVYRLKGYETSATFYVTRSNPGGGWHMFELSRQPEAFQKGKTRPFVATLDCEFDLTPDGRICGKPVGSTDNVLSFLPMLPDAAAAEWEARWRQVGLNGKLFAFTSCRPRSRRCGISRGTSTARFSAT